MELELDYKGVQFGVKDQVILKDVVEKCSVKNPIIFEVGCWTGRSTSILGNFAKDHNGVVTTIDKFDGTGSHLEEYAKDVDIESILRSNLKKLGIYFYVHVINANSDDIFEQIYDNSIDFMFIDGDHRYSQVKKDLDNWWPKIKPGGIFCGHDCEGLEYDKRYIEEDYENNRHNGVCKAVFDKFKEVNIEDSIIWWIVK